MFPLYNDNLPIDIYNIAIFAIEIRNKRFHKF